MRMWKAWRETQYATPQSQLEGSANEQAAYVSTGGAGAGAPTEGATSVAAEASCGAKQKMRLLDTGVHEWTAITNTDKTPKSAAPKGSPGGHPSDSHKHGQEEMETDADGLVPVATLDSRHVKKGSGGAL